MNRTLLLALSLFCLPSCTSIAPFDTTYLGKIERVESPDYSGYIISPRSSSAVYRLNIYVGLIAPRPDDPTTVCIQVADAESMDRYGSVGDTIAFQWFTHLPVDGRLPFESLQSYTIHLRPR
jgi:hypothetical protein